MKKTFFIACSFVCICLQVLDAQGVVTFEELQLSPSTTWTGADGSGSFTSSYLTLYNAYDGTYGSWQGFAYGNQSDTLSEEYTNLTPAAGGGVGGSANYAVGFVGADWQHDYAPIAAGLRIDTTQAGNFDGRGAYFCLTNYTKRYIDNTFAGGDFWLKLTISAFDGSSEVARREILLADYTGGNNYKMATWTFVDLSWIAHADSLNFIVTSNDEGDYGINTPAFFCLDDFGAATPTLSSPAQQPTTSSHAYLNNYGHLIVNSNTTADNIAIYDISGKQAFAQTNKNSTWDIDFNAFDSGMYVIVLTTKNQSESLKIVKP